MLYLYPILVIFAVATFGDGKRNIVLDPGLLASFTEKGTNCQMESGADPSALGKIFPWQMEESETNGKFLYCLMGELKFLGDDDNLNIDKFMDVFGETMKSENKDEFRNVLAECKKQTGKNKYLSVYKMANCIHDKSPFGITVV